MEDQFQEGKASYYARLLKSRPPGSGWPPTDGATFESMSMDDGDSEGFDPKEVLERAKANLYKVIEDYLGNKPELKALADKILTEGGDAVHAVADLNDDYLTGQPEMLVQLETIVRTDGSRPSFLVRQGVPDLASSPIGTWNGSLGESSDALRKAISCVGRIDRQGRHVGTGFLIAPDLVVTNRHVLQGIAQPRPDGKWTLYPNITIDFGKEFQGITSYNARAIRDVVFCGDKQIGNPLDHAKLDLALLLLEVATPFTHPVEPLPLQADGGWNYPGTYVYVIGYPGDPGLGGQMTYGSLLEQLFHDTFGCKRLAPGGLMDNLAGTQPWTLTHDATTLAGNSGSVMVLVNQEFGAAGLHYGGTLDAPRQNWGHNLSMTLDQTNASLTQGTLRDCLQHYGAIG